MAADDQDDKGLKVYFNPFAFTIEENNEMIAKGYEVMPIAIPEEHPHGCKCQRICGGDQ